MGTYQLTFKSCDQSYVGQTWRSLKIRLQGHITYIGSNSPQSAYAQQILCNRHEYGTMNNLMTLVKHVNNTNMLSPCEQFYIQTLHRERKLIPEQCPGDSNPLFELAIHNTHKLHYRVSHTSSLILNTYPAALLQTAYNQQPRVCTVN
jgi:hypothetical protein